MLWWTLRQLGSRDRKQRERAIEKLVAAGAVNPLIKALDHENWEVRAVAAKALEQIADASAVEPLIRSLKDGESHVRQCAAYALKEIGDARAALPLALALKDSSEYVRRAALSALEALGAETLRDPGAVEPLVALLKKRSWDGGAFAASALGEIGGARVVEPLVTELQGYDDEKDEAVIAALKKVGGAPAIELLLAALKAATQNQRRTVLMKALDEFGWEPANDDERALRALARKDWDALIHFGETGIACLAATLDEYDEEVRRGASTALAQIGGPRIEQLLKAKIKEGLFWAKIAAASALLKINPQWATADESNKYVALLIKRLKDADLREQAAEALVEIRSPRAVELLIRAVNGSNWDVTKSAMAALGRIKAPESVGPLLDKIRIKDGSPDSWFYQAEIATEALRQIMETVVQELPRELLNAVAALPNHPSFSQANECFTYSREVNCSQLVQMARQELLRRASSNPRDTFNLALTTAKYGELTEAIKLFEGIPADAAEHRAAVFNRAILWARGGQAQVAVTLLESLQDSSPVVTSALRECREAADKDGGLAWDSGIELVQTL